MNCTRTLSAIFCAIALLLTAPTSEAAGEFTVFTNVVPPIKYVKDDRITGITGDILAHILNKEGFGIKEPARPLPLAETIERTQSEPGSICLGLAKTPQRRPHFKWVGPAYTVNTGIIAKKSKRLSIPRLKDTKGLTLASVIDSAPENRLKGKAFEEEQLKRFPTTHEAVRALADDEVDGLLMPTSPAYAIMEELGIPADEYVTVITLDSLELYFAFHLNTSNSLIDRLQAELEAMRKTDGQGMSLYLSIISRYPGRSY